MVLKSFVATHRALQLSSDSVMPSHLSAIEMASIFLTDSGSGVDSFLDGRLRYQSATVHFISTSKVRREGLLGRRKSSTLSSNICDDTRKFVFMEPPLSEQTFGLIVPWIKPERTASV